MFSQQSLLDQVAPFSSDEAKVLLEKELGKPLEELFEDATVFDKPVASASIGQVASPPFSTACSAVSWKLWLPHRVCYKLPCVADLLHSLATVGSLVFMWCSL